MLDFRVKNELKKLDKTILSANGFESVDGEAYYKKFGNFEVILNPCMINGTRKVVVNFLYDEELTDDQLMDEFVHIDESCMAYDIWETINMLIANEIIYLEREEV